MQTNPSSRCTNCGSQSKFILCYSCWLQRENNLGTVNRYIHINGLNPEQEFDDKKLIQDLLNNSFRNESKEHN